MGYAPAGYADGGSYTFHFPDVNATIARLLIRKLSPAAVPGHDCRDVVSARVDYHQLDRPSRPVHIRLSSTVVRARNQDDPAALSGVEIAYARGKQVFTVQAKDCVLACWKMMIPYLCPELPEAQKAALHSLVKTPLVYTSVALRNWRAFHRLGIAGVKAPGGYHTYFHLSPAVDIGGYTAERSPDRPILLHMVRTPCHPGLSEHDQNRAGPSFWPRHLRPSSARSANNSAAHWPTVASIRRATLPLSLSTVGRTATRRSSIRCGSRTCRPISSQM